MNLHSYTFFVKFKNWLKLFDTTDKLHFIIDSCCRASAEMESLKNAVAHPHLPEDQKSSSSDSEIWEIVINRPHLKIWRRPMGRQHLFEYKSEFIEFCFLWLPDDFIINYPNLNRLPLHTYVQNLSSHTINIIEIWVLERKFSFLRYWIRLFIFLILCILKFKFKWYYF